VLLYDVFYSNKKYTKTKFKLSIQMVSDDEPLFEFADDDDDV
jgi:hypothetical protein